MAKILCPEHGFVPTAGCCGEEELVVFDLETDSKFEPWSQEDWNKILDEIFGDDSLDKKVEVEGAWL